ncbi:MAG: DegT/DnrJ/EryC1/StrS family aminotransferase [Bacteroidia bacterium]|nr:DegT/DnrJ/EryC1/StrS family aminotransferase [Bacteroidia bacterium]MCC7532432.1 DegT/DnrJ/EryC1/StrS family aminotransferase [Bacteroidia bacterium]
MKIQFVNLKAQYQSIKPEIDKIISQVIEETSFIGGKHVEQFEKNFAELYGVKHCISVANGTDSLYIIMKMLGIGTGDEVITSAHSWISSSETISQTGATPIFVDTEPEYFTIDIKKIESKITTKTKAIIPVHLYGQMVDMEGLLELANKHNIHIIEDCAQSHFSEFKGKRAGTMGIAGSFSFYPGKNLGAYGDAGCIITNDDKLAEHCKMFARHGALIKHQHKIEGINSRLDGLQAAILNVKLSYIQKWTEARIRNAKIYDLKFKSKNLIGVSYPTIRPETKHTFHLYVIKTNKRNELKKFLYEKGIETAIHYPSSLPMLDCYKHRNFNSKEYSNSILDSQSILSIPMYPELTEVEIDYVVESISEFFGNNN